MAQARVASFKQAYHRVNRRYRRDSLLASFYTFYRTWTCPFQQIFAHVPDGGRIIDVGCGNGFVTLWTALVFPNARVLGIDMNAGRIDTARKHSRDTANVSFAVGDITGLPLERADVFLLIDLLHHICWDDQLALLDACVDRLSPGGMVVLKDIGVTPRWKYCFHYLQDSLHYRQKLFCREPEKYTAFFTDRGMQARYIPLDKGYPYPHYMITARRPQP